MQTYPKDNCEDEPRRREVHCLQHPGPLPLPGGLPGPDRANMESGARDESGRDRAFRQVWDCQDPGDGQD